MPPIPASPVSRSPTLGEEVANSVSHGPGLLLAIVGLPILIIHAVRTGSTAAVVGAAIFGSSAILLYLFTLSDRGDEHVPSHGKCCIPAPMDSA